MAIKDYQPNMVLAQTKYNVVGTRPVRHDGADKVTGRAQYGADFQTASLQFGAILRSPHAHAKIKSIDTSKADAYPGVMATVTAKDFPDTDASDDQHVKLGELSTSLGYLRDNILASNKVLYKGHAVAGVAAINAHIAQEAVELIKVEYEVLSSATTPVDAMNDAASILHDHLKTEELGEKTDKISNVAEHFQHVLGDIDKGFSEADVIAEREFTTQTVHQGYIEPQNFSAFWNKDGKVTIWCSTQGPFEVRDASAEALSLNIADIKLVPMEIGGGFGGKFEPYGAPVAAMLSKKTGKAVKIVMSRAEDLQGTGPTPGSYMKVKMGATKDGKIVAANAYLAFEAGAFPGSPVGAAAMCVFAAYDIPNVTVDGFDVVNNKPKMGAYRAPGATQASFASETIVDELAEKTGIDPIEFRLMNAAKEGSRRADGPVHPKIGCVEVLEAMRDHDHYNAPLEGPHKGRGVAVGYWINGGGPSACTIRVNPDGSLTLSEGSADIGGTRTSVSMQAAEVLGVPVELFNPQVVDTDSVGYTSGTGGSGVTHKTGWAAYEAAHHVKKQLIERASKIWDISADDIEMENGSLRSISDQSLTMSLPEIAEQLLDTGGPVVGSSNIDPPAIGSAYAGCIVDVDVDPDTGKTTIERFTMVQDAGKAIHPSYVEGQMQGGSVQGIGWALNEGYYMNESGEMMNTSFLDYRIPVILDLPMIDTVIVEVPSPTHPYGVRGVGEVNLVPPPAAIANGIYRAQGVRMDKLPMNPAAVMEAVWNK